MRPSEIVFLLEEESVKVMLEGILPRVLEPGIAHRLIAFEGKQDLEKQLVRKLRGYQNPKARFLVLRDQDSTPDCRAVKKKLQLLIRTAGRSDVSLVRIACRELEAFYLADLLAVEQALGISGLALNQNSATLRNDIDLLERPSEQLSQLTDRAYQKVSGSRLLGPLLNLENGRSKSFQALLAGIRHLQDELLGRSALSPVRSRVRARSVTHPMRTTGTSSRRRRRYGF